MIRRAIGNNGRTLAAKVKGERYDESGMRTVNG